MVVVLIGEGAKIMITRRGALGGVESGAYLVILGFLLACLSVAYGLQPRSEGPRFPPSPEPGTWTRWAPLVAIVLLASYTFFMDYLGYLLSTALFFAAYLRVFGSYRWIPVLAASFGLAVASVYLWLSMGLVMPRGIVPWP